MLTTAGGGCSGGGTSGAVRGRLSTSFPQLPPSTPPPVAGSIGRGAVKLAMSTPHAEVAGRAWRGADTNAAEYGYDATDSCTITSASCTIEYDGKGATDASTCTPPLVAGPAASDERGTEITEYDEVDSDVFDAIDSTSDSVGPERRIHEESLETCVCCDMVRLWLETPHNNLLRRWLVE